MRLLICDRHMTFAESLAHTLRGRGDDVVGIVADVRQASEFEVDRPVEVCVVSVATAGDLGDGDELALRALAARTALILVGDEYTAELRDAGRRSGARAVAEKSAGINDMLQIIDRVHRGEAVSLEACDRPRSPGRQAEGAADSPAASLSPREREVLCQLVRGLDTIGVAGAMGISSTTARTHIQSVLLKLDARTRITAVTTAVNSGLINPVTGKWLPN